MIKLELGADTVSLFPELDEKETLKEVAKFFTKDLERLLLMSGHELVDLKSPTLSSAPGHSNGSNNSEVAIIRGLNAEAMVKATSDTIHHCSHNSEVILIGLFIKKYPWEQVKPLVYSENNKFSYLRRKAMFEFADGFDYWQRVNHCQPIIDLHKYKIG